MVNGSRLPLHPSLKRLNAGDHRSESGGDLCAYIYLIRSSMQFQVARKLRRCLATSTVYPARFSPFFAREAIKCFTQPGEFVLDPFCGGGTTLVEAISLGRRAAGIDISSLAAFWREQRPPLSLFTTSGRLVLGLMELSPRSHAGLSASVKALMRIPRIPYFG
jgi:hypothetical protein